MFNLTQIKNNHMEKKKYQIPQMEVVTVNSQSMLAMSDVDSNVFDGGYTGGGSTPGHANKRRGWSNEW